MNKLKDKVRTIIDYPKEGILFRDITPLLKDPGAFNEMIGLFITHFEQSLLQFDYVVGIEARGFVIGSAIAYALGKGFVPIRKPGKLPSEVLSEQYQLEYRSDSLEIHQDAINPGGKVILVDDLLATGGTVLAAISLVKRLGGIIQECAFLINLPDVGGYQRLESYGYPIFYLMEFQESSHSYSFPQQNEGKMTSLF